MKNGMIRKGDGRRGARIFGDRTEVFDPKGDVTLVKPVVSELAKGKLIAYSEGIMTGRRFRDGHREMDVRVFRLAASAQNPHTLQTFLAEQNRDGKPRSVLINDFKMAKSLAIVTPETQELMRNFWPGALTIIMRRNKGTNIPSFTDSEKDEKVIGLQMPANSMITYLIKQTGMALVTASACLSIDKVTDEAIAEKMLIDSLYNKVNVLIRGAKRFQAKESTLLDMSGDNPTILRQGEVSQESIVTVLRTPVKVIRNGCKTDKARRSTDLVTA